MICPCGTDPNKRTRIQQIQKEYASYTQSLIDAGIYDKDDFTVVFQPFLRDTKPPTDVNIPFSIFERRYFRVQRLKLVLAMVGNWRSHNDPLPMVHSQIFYSV